METDRSQFAVESGEPSIPPSTHLRAVFNKVLGEVGAKRAIGAAPPGAMEEMLQKVLPES
eukprot:9469509-Pyramimonas_sp.AAC.1